MKSKFSIKRVFGGIVFLLGSFITASAQTAPVNVYSTSADYYNPQFNYMMGTVVLPGSVPPVSIPATPTNNIQGNVVPANSCPALFTSYHKFGDLSEEVATLQKFLNDFNGAKLNGFGYFGPATQQEVKNLQYAYGIKPTGAQYEKTTELINKIVCGEVPLRERVAYVSQMSYSKNISGSSVTNAKNVPLNEVYPNAPKGVIDTVPSKPIKNISKNATSTKNGTGTLSTSTSSIFSSFQNDIDRVRENYKAYLLVFVLVLALFWFLRKAATE